MKTRLVVPFGVLVLFFLVVSCRTTGPATANPDYDAGSKLAETYAKEDAKKLSCLLYRRKAWRNVMSGNLTEHTAALKNEKTEEFLNAFIEGYRKYFAEYADMYCGK